MNTWTLIRAILFLDVNTVRNRLRMRVRRLRQPKYLAGAIVGACYMGWLFGFQLLRSLVSGRPRPDVLAAAFGNGLELFGTLIVLILMLAAWIFHRPRAVLAFSEPELAFLLPAPISRRLLVRYRLLSAQSGMLVSSVILCIVTGRFWMDSHTGIRVLGVWLVLTALTLHRCGASFTVQRVTERGLATWKYRAGVILFLTALLGAVWWTLREAATGLRLDLESPESAIESLKRIVDSGISQTVLWPFRILVRPALAPDWTAFFLRLGPALAEVALLFVWVDRSDVAFEEASLRASERMANAMKAFRDRNGKIAPAPKRRRKPVFDLQPCGPAWAAFAWSSLMASGVAKRNSLVFGGIGVVLAIAGLPGILLKLGEPLPEQGVRTALFGFSCLCAAVAILLSAIRILQGVHRHLAMADWVKTYPVAGRSVLLGHFLGPMAPLVTSQAICGLIALTTASGFAASISDSVSGPDVLLLFAAGGGLTIPVTWLLASVPVASLLLFPAWAGSSAQNQTMGFEATGHRLIVMLVQLLMLVVVLLPAAAAAAALGGAIYLAGWAKAAVAVAIAAGGATLWFEAIAAVLLLGRLYDRFDPGELTPGN